MRFVDPKRASALARVDLAHVSMIEAPPERGSGPRPIAREDTQTRLERIDKVLKDFVEEADLVMRSSAGAHAEASALQFEAREARAASQERKRSGTYSFPPDAILVPPATKRAT